MIYLLNINSLSDLKQKYRKLAFLHHPDKGGDVAVMQALNNEFEKLFIIWKDKTDSNTNGYANDYSAASASQYKDYVYNEYKWTGANYDSSLYTSDLTKLFKQHLKNIYPSMKWSITKLHHSSISVNLMEADFFPFIDITVKEKSINHYWINDNKELSERGLEVFKTVIDFCNSYNFDDSDSQTDYFHTNFYINFSVGKYDKFFNMSANQIGGKVARTKVGETQRAINKAMTGAKWEDVTFRDGNIYKLLCPKNDLNDAYPFTFSSYSQAQKRYDKLINSGIDCKIIGNGSYKKIMFIAYTPETLQKLEAEKEALKEVKPQVKEIKQPEQAPKEAATSTKTKADIQIIDYSEKAVAVIGNTYEIKGQLKAMGGRFNRFLSCGAGWIFSAKKKDELLQLI